MSSTSSLTPAERISRVNAELAELFSRPPVPLRAGATLRRRDELVVCGLLGGKDVGKSTLINALADRSVSVDRAVVGEGTPRPIAYTHEDEADTLRGRLGSAAAGPIDHQIVTHRVDDIRRLVLVDLPDIDSTFHEHLETVRRAVERMDRVVWVFDPKKGDDRAMAALLPRVVRDPDNVYCVLNKFDQTLKDETNGAGPDAFWTTKRDWFRGCLQSLGMNPDDRRRFLISAKYTRPDAFARAVAGFWFDNPAATPDEHDRQLVHGLAERSTRDIARLKTELLQPLTKDEARHIKHANESAELAADVEDIHRQYELDRTVDAVSALVAEIDRQYTHEFEHDYLSTLARRLAATGRSDVELARDLMAYRVERWPLLPVLYWPLSGLVRWLGGRLAAAGPHRPAPPPADLLRVRGRGLDHRAASFHERVVARTVTLPDGLLPANRLPDPKAQAAAAAARIIERWQKLDDDVLDACKVDTAPPTRLARFSLWFVLIWFPLLQPLAKGALTLVVERSVAGGLRAALAVVTAFGALSLGTGLVAAGMVFLIVLAVMFARAIRDVRRTRGDHPAQPGDADPYADEVSQILNDEIHEPLREPAEHVASRLQRCRHELDELRGARP
ncbi:MAG: 50S ribosome-binding GTPase [Phycisphaerales bacterium]|nr:MAG: 50S ribosome-binding GTPase [Phycisphaerales bacterium]